MMSILSMSLFTLVMLPVYLALRYPFFRLPLHIDTGFYVSNHTICKRKINFSKGWNAHFAGCSKVIPELFYSVIYSVHRGKGYKSYSRFYFSLYNYMTAILVGYAAYTLGGHSEHLYYAGLVSYCLLSSEPHYGIYFESGEQFELLFHVAGFLLILLGIQNSDPYFVAGGFGIWCFDGFFIKLSSLISSGILALSIGMFFPSSLPHMAVAGSIGLGLYLAWIWANRRSVLKLVKPVIGHEKYYGHRFAIKHYARRFLHKAWFLWKVSRSLPIVPGLAALGGVIIGDRISFVLIYLGAVAAAYLFQSAQVWYYTIPFLPACAILAAFGVGWLSNQGINGLVVICVLGLVWLSVHVGQSYGNLLLRDIALLNRYVWEPHGVSMAEKNLCLEEVAPSLRSSVGGRSMFIFGAWNQAYVLLESSYDTPLISAGRWLDDMMPKWQRALNECFLRDPPGFLLDTDNCLDVEVFRKNLGLDYRLIGIFGSQFRLFALNGSVVRERTHLDCNPFISQE